MVYTTMYYLIAIITPQLRYVGLSHFFFSKIQTIFHGVNNKLYYKLNLFYYILLYIHILTIK